MGEHLRVCFSNNKHCFCQISNKTLSGRFDQSIDSLVCLKLTTRTGFCFMTGSSVSGTGDNDIHINGLYANKLSLTEGDTVHLEIIDSPPTASKVAIEPVSVDDWEILELNTEYIQSELLNQVRVVWTGQVMPIWVSGNICIFIKVGWMEPEAAAYMQLDQLTELIVSPKGRQRVLARTSSNQTSNNFQSTNQGSSDATSANQKFSSTKLARSQPERRTCVDEQPPSSSIRSSLQFDTSLQTSVDADVGPQTDSRTIVHESSQNALYGVLRRWLPSFLTPENSPTEGAVAMPGTHNVDTSNRQWKEGEITHVVGRVLISSFHKLSSWWSKYPSICVVNKSLVPQATTTHFLAELHILLSPMEVEAETKLAAKFRRKNQQAPPTTKTEKHIGTVCVVVRGVDDSTLPIPAGHIMLDEMFCKLHRIKLTSKVRLAKVTSQHSKIATIQIQPTHSVPEFLDKKAMLVAFKNYLRAVTSHQGYPLLLLSSNTLNIEIAAGKSVNFLVLVFQSAIQQKPGKDPTSEEHKGPSTPSPSYFLLRPGSLEDVGVKCEQIITNRCHFSVTPDGMVSSGTPNYSPVGCPQLQVKLTNFVQSSLQCRTEGGLLLTGSRGTGKTTLATSVLHHMVKHCYCYTHSLDSTQLRGKRPDAIRRLLDTTIQECIWRQPSVLFIDDLDALCKAAAGPEEEANPEIAYSCKISEVIKDRLGSMWRHRVQVAVIATCVSRASLNPKLTATHGVHVFHLTEDIPGLSQISRCSMLKSVMYSLGIKNIPSDKQLMSHADRLEGYVVRDLVAVVKRAAHAHTIFSGEIPTTSISIEDLDAALEGFTPASLRGVVLHSPGDNTWKDVGGLHNVKEQLVRMLEWPAKYRKLYAQCPIRLQSGVLLYGAPGTGKTLVAAVVAREMGLNFISIKGPELLNKYIGASEQGVRDTFKRAQDVKPCILFFDEFESLAPRRGHDSTGVTDRVVNQLLTQLDGVEALEGVYVLAATSRPDLIDPALLRPGRLDKSLCCGIPTPEDRLEILYALTRQMKIDSEIDLVEVANSCEECTGADIKSLLVNAQLEAVHDLLDNSLLYRDSGIISDVNEETDELVTGIYKSSIDEEAQPITPQSPCYQQVLKLYSQTSGNTLSRRTTPSSDTQVIIRPSHIDCALSSLQPSVSPEERAKYQLIYEQFTSSKDGRTSAQPNQMVTTKQRVSLA